MVRAALLVSLLSLGPVSLSAVTAQAEEHVVIILDTAFFPDTTILRPGDVVRFVNESKQAKAIIHVQGVWETPSIATGDAIWVTITPDMIGKFVSTSGKRIVGQLLLDEPSAADEEVR